MNTEYQNSTENTPAHVRDSGFGPNAATSTVFSKRFDFASIEQFRTMQA
jgi:hypothetical protein